MGSLIRKLIRTQEKENRLRGRNKIYFKKVAENMYAMGTCRCGGCLNAYLGSKPENRFNVYCSQCGSISDVRTPKSGDAYILNEGENPLKVLIKGYKQFKNYEITDAEIKETPISAVVNEIHGEVHGEI